MQYLLSLAWHLLITSELAAAGGLAIYRLLFSIIGQKAFDRRSKQMPASKGFIALLATLTISNDTLQRCLQCEINYRGPGAPSSKE